MTESKYFITTAIDYPNSLPHIGTAFEKIGADVQARYRRMLGNNVCFLMGNDENTLKVWKRAEELGKEPKAYCDEMAVQFRAVWDALSISYDRFIQTTDPEHARCVTSFIEAIQTHDLARNQKSFYKKSYTGFYCEGCEEFKTNADRLPHTGRCPNHPTRALVPVEEENWFFALTQHKEWLRGLLQDHLKVIPQSRLPEIDHLLENLQDVSITRKGLPWGIPFPGDPEQKIYVWFDALLNYWTGGGSHWPPDMQFIGKDITRFHCLLWPAMLHAAGLNFNMLPRKIFIHGFITQGGVKESKSGHATNPMDLVQEYGVDAYRYYFLSKCQFDNDGEYDADHFKQVYNSELANNLGNLINRVFTLANKHLNNVIPENHYPKGWITKQDAEQWGRCLQTCDYVGGLKQIWAVLDKINAYVEVTTPWTLAKNKQYEYLGYVLADCVAGLRAVAVLLKPYLPTTSQKIIGMIDPNCVWADLDVAVTVECGLCQFDHSKTKTLELVDVAVNGKIPPMFPRKE